MSNMRLKNHTWDAENVYDASIGKSQAEINAQRTGYDLYPTGTDQNRSTEIVACFQSQRVCRLAPGTYYVDNFSMRANSCLIGAGTANTKLVFKDLGDTPAWYAIRIRGNTTIANLTLDGGNSETLVETYSDGVHGIRIGDNTTYHPSATEDYECNIENVIIKNFSGCGIFARYSGQKSQGGGVFTNVRVEKCSAGFYIGEHAEYYTLIGCHANECYTGLVNIGGNNIISDCTFGNNEVGINFPGEDIYGSSQNTAHGIVANCKITHCGEITGTDGFSIKSIGQTGNMLISGCMLGYPMYFQNCGKSIGGGFVFAGCVIKGNKQITVDNSYVSMFDTMFESASLPVSCLNTGILRRRGCIAFNGTELSDVTAPVNNG